MIEDGDKEFYDTFGYKKGKGAIPFKDLLGEGSSPQVARDIQHSMANALVELENTNSIFIFDETAEECLEQEDYLDVLISLYTRPRHLFTCHLQFCRSKSRMYIRHSSVTLTSKLFGIGCIKFEDITFEAKTTFLKALKGDKKHTEHAAVMVSKPELALIDEPAIMAPRKRKACEIKLAAKALARLKKGDKLNPVVIVL